MHHCVVSRNSASKAGGGIHNAGTISVSYTTLSDNGSQNADGGFRYMLAPGESAFPRSAAGVVALYSAGVYKGHEIDRGLTYLDQFLPRGGAGACITM